MTPYEHLCLDIETTNGDPTDAERWARLLWSPDSRWKPETIGIRYLDAIAKKKERLALIDTSPVITIGLKTEQDLRCLHCMMAHDPRPVAAGLVEGFATERQMLIALRNLIEAACDPETVLIGHNLKGFDLPKIRGRFVRHGLRLPWALASKDQPLYDTMSEYGRFSLESAPFISAADLADCFGLASHKGIVEGAQVPELYAAGKHDEIICYCMLDVELEYQIFCRMTGQLGDAADVLPFPSSTAPAASQASAASPATNPAPTVARIDF